MSNQSDIEAATAGDAPVRIRNGIFLAPFHPVREDPTLAIERDLQLVQLLDELNYAEAWIGEHHSCGFEILASPELFIAAAAERTRHIRLGTGVVSLPYHNPLTATNRILQLDHQTRGRVMLGVGPGLLPYDAHMLGVEIATQRDRMAQSLDVILRLMRGEIVTEATDWYDLRDARIHLLPYSDPHPEVAVASTVTPSGGKLAGRHDLGMLCVAATSASGFDALDVNWNIACETARERGREMDRSRLRLVGPVHLAETREQAFANVEHGLLQWVDYFSTFNPAGGGLELGDATARQVAEGMVASGQAVIGTPEDAVAQLRRLWDKTGGFGVFLQLAHNWADWDATRKSYELFARYVTPLLSGANRARGESLAWARENSERFMSQTVAAAQAAFAKHAAESGESGEAGEAKGGGERQKKASGS